MTEIDKLNKELIYATLKKDTKKVKELIDAGADIYFSFEELEDEYEGGNAWGIACSQYFYDENSDSTMFDLFEGIENQNKLNSEDMNIVLHTAAKVGNMDKLIEALENGAYIEGDVFDDEDSPLVTAVEMGNTKVAEYLIENGANINAYFTKSEPVLMRAIITDNTQIAKLLINKGADIFATSGMGRNMIGIAAQKGNLEIVKTLFKHNIDPFEEDERGMNALEYAVKFEQHDIEVFLKNLEEDGI